ncbi:Oligopeptidase A [Trichostrongylus colubriformis]|uniref:Oligopeptidase A n=1 Tax=Trichostrongylus colubriformis TaxID=6319 RepID=A0AAN8EZT5_TRICO
MYRSLRWCTRSKYANTARFMSFVSNRSHGLNSIPCLQKCIQKRNILFKMGNETPSRVVGYYVVFPHIPDETVENNRFMYNISKGEDWPTLATATPKEMYEGTVRMLMEYGATCMEHLELLNKLSAEERTFETVVEPLLTEEYDVDYALQTLLLKMLTDWPDCDRKLFDADLHHIKIMSARDHMEKLSNSDFQDAIKQLYDAKEGLDEWQLRLLEWYLLEIRASGLDRRDEKTRKLIGSWNRFIDEYRSKYIAKWEEGPWRGRMTPYSIYPFLEYCRNRQLRAEAWEKWISKASFDHDFYNNSVNVEELRHNNEGLAKTLGFSSVAEHRLANKMAASPDTVRSFLNALTRRIRPVFIDRMESWTAFAQAKEMMSSSLQAHDLAYICRREAEQHYDVDPLDLMNHFPFWPTFTNLTKIIGSIFGLEFHDVTDGGLERAHPDVRIFSVDDVTTGEHLGRLYIDPYDREAKRGTWNTLLGRMESKVRGLDKIVYLIGSAIAPMGSTPSLLHHQQLQQLLFHVGRSVQMLLSRAPYRDIAIPWAPFYASDWDAADAFPAFLQFFVYKPTLLQSLSSPHILNNSTMSDEYANNICLSLSRSTLWESYRSMFWADFDLTIFEMEDRKQKFWLDLYREMTKEYFPFKAGRNDYQPCSFIPIFGLQPYMGMYYRKLWTEEHYLVVYYIMRAVCIREENLRSRLNFDQKQLRQLLAGLKNEKLVKDRLLQQKNETGRNVSIIFYFINYRAIINVLKYKIDHMRQMLEAREKNELQKANYKCEQCGAQYECWRCQGEVTQDITGGPTQVTRTLLARFNEQMLPLFAAIRELAGIQLAPHLLEPDINQYLAEEDKSTETNQQLVDFSTAAGGPRAQLGGSAHSYHTGPSIKYANADQITVDLNADTNSKPVEEAKVVPTWLQDDAIGGSEQNVVDDAAGMAADGAEPLPHVSSSVSLSLMAELENIEEPSQKRPRTDDDENGTAQNEPGTDEEDAEEDEEETVLVAGKMVPLSEVTSEMVAEMTEEERDRYTAIMQENLYY